jgi:hypothetical protein
MPENVWEALRWIEKGKTAEKNIPVSPEKPAIRRPLYREEHQEHRSTNDRSTWKLLTAPPPTPRLPLNLFDFSSPKGNMGRRDFENPVNQRDFKTPMKSMDPEDRKRSPSPQTEEVQAGTSQRKLNLLQDPPYTGASTEKRRRSKIHASQSLL